MKEDKSYLGRLKFDPRLLATFRAKYLTNIRVVILLIILIFVIGITSYINLPRRLNPEVNIPIVTISTILPGASPEDIESLVTIPLEESITGVENIDEVSSVSNESFSNVVIQFTSGTDLDKAKSDVQSAVDTVTLPEDAQEPRIQTLDFEDTPVLNFAVITNSDIASLQRFSATLQDRLEELSRVDRVQITGLETQEIQILAKPEAISTYNLNPLSLSRAIQAALSSYPAGNINTTTSSFSIGINAPVSSIQDIRNTILSVDGNQVKLSDVATIVERPKPNAKNSYYADKNTTPTKVVSFSVYKTKTSTINQAGTDMEKEIEETLKGYGNQFRVIYITNTAEQISDQFNELFVNFRDTIILVFITFLIFLGFRQAIIASLTIPLTFLMAFTIMQVSGLSMNFLSVFSLLLALGLLVDDTIVIVTGITAYYRSGKFTPTEAGLLVWKDFIIPIWSTTITTVWAFLPLLIATGIIGEFIKTIPIVVAASLYSSTSIAVLITLPLMMAILKPNVPFRVKLLLRIIIITILTGFIILISSQNPLLPLILIVFFLLIFITFRVRTHIANRISKRFFSKTRSFNIQDKINNGFVDFSKVGARYYNLVAKILSSQRGRRNVVIGVTFFIVFAFLLLPLGFVVNEFFPKSQSEVIYVTVEFPSGTNLNTTDMESRNLLNQLRKTEGVNYVTVDEGRGVGDGGQSFTTGDNLALINLVLPKVDDQKISSLDIAKKIRNKFANYSQATISVFEPSGGPPAGSDIQIQLQGPELEQLDMYADKVVSFLEKQTGVINVNKSIKPGTSRITFIPDEIKLAQNGLTIDSIGLWLRTFNTGLTFDSIEIDDQSQDIVFRMNSENQQVSDLGKLSIPVPPQPGGIPSQSKYIPLLSLGRVTLEPNPTQITRTDGKRTISVSAGVTPGSPIPLINQQLENFAENDLNLASGYSWKTGGVNEENQESLNSIFQAMIIAAILIFSTMVVQFRSYRQAVLVMLVIPIAVSGVFVVFALTGTPLSFPAVIGVLSLFGIVVTQAMVLVDKINLNLRSGLPIKEALADAGAARLEPIFLGSLTTILGLIPITLSDPLWRGLGGAIIAGLSISGVIMLIFIPVVYYMWFSRTKK